MWLLRAMSCIAVAAATGCATLPSIGSPEPDEWSAIIHTGGTTVREIDGELRRGGTFDTRHFRVAPGRHRLALVLHVPARTVGLRDVPAQRGEGTCVLEFIARAGHQYWLGARPIGDTWASGRWDGRWEGWVRDPASNEVDDIIARCSSQPVLETEQPVAVATPLPALEEPTAAPVTAADVAVAAPPPPPAPAATAPPPIAAEFSSAPPTAAESVSAPPPAPPAVVVPAAAQRAAAPRGIRFATWQREQLADRDIDGGNGFARAVDGRFDVVTVIDLEPERCRRLLAALGEDWSRYDPAAPACTAYRHRRARPCADWTIAEANSAAAAMCFEPVDGD